MHRDHPPCNTCTKHDCRNCAWTSPLDASYRSFFQPHSILSILATDVRSHDPMPAEPSWLGLAARRVMRFFKSCTPRAR
jgi:hypothetical protein